MALEKSKAMMLFLKIAVITKELSPWARELLGTQFDRVIDIDRIQMETSVTGGRQDRACLLTRFEALGLGSAYDRIVLLDADILPLCDYDSLFSLPAPAGILMQGKQDYLELDAAGNVLWRADERGKWGWHAKYDAVCPHGEPIPAALTDRVLQDVGNMGVNAGLWVLARSMEEYRALTEYRSQPHITELVEKQFPWPEMQLATAAWSGRWTSIDIRYCSIGGYPSTQVLGGIHFAGLKPWQVRHRSIEHYASHTDFRLWYDYFTALYWSVPAVRQNPGLRRIWEFIRRKEQNGAARETTRL